MMMIMMIIIIIKIQIAMLTATNSPWRTRSLRGWLNVGMEECDLGLCPTEADEDTAKIKKRLEIP